LGSFIAQSGFVAGGKGVYLDRVVASSFIVEFIDVGIEPGALV
jgi:hypothetical protein